MNDASLSATKSLTLKGAILACCFCIFFVSLHAVFPSGTASVKFLGYVVIYNFLPGLVVTRLILPRLTEVSAFLVFSLAVGVVVNTLLMTMLWSMDLLRFFLFLPVIFLIVAIGCFRRLQLSNYTGRLSEAVSAQWILGAVFWSLTALLGIGFIYSSDFNDSFSAHAAFQGVIVRGLEAGSPPPNLLLPGVAWSYNYAAHLWILGVNQTTGLSIEVLVSRYGPLFLGGTSAALLSAFGRHVLRLDWWIAALPVFCVYWLIGITPISGAVFASFMPFAANLILSPFLAIMVFLLAIAVASESNSGTPRSMTTRFALLAAFAFLITGARGVCGPILLCAFALRALVSVLRSKNSKLSIVDLAAVATGFAGGLRLFFTVGTGFTGTGVLKFTGQPFTFLAGDQPVLTLAQTLMEMRVPWLPAAVVAFCAIAIFQGAFLTPALTVSFVELRKTPKDSYLLLIGSGIAGLAGFFLTVAPGLSHVSFLYFSNISFSLLGACGLQKLLLGFELKSWRNLRFETAVLALVFVLAAIHFAQLPMRTVAWVGEQWMIAADSVARLFPERTINLAECSLEEDSDLFAKASQTATAPVVIVIPAQHSNCGPFWWIVRSPIQTLSDYMLEYVPGTTEDPTLRNTIRTQKLGMEKALALAKKGDLDVEDLLAIASTMGGSRPVFVMAPRNLKSAPDSRMRPIGASNTFALWRLDAGQ